MGGIYIPGGDRTVPFEQISKKQLAEQVNRQTETIKKLRENVYRASSMLATIVDEPDAVTREGNTLVVNAEASKRVYGRLVHIEDGDGVVRVWTQEDTSRGIQIPTVGRIPRTD